MASIHTRVNSAGETTWRVAYREDRALRWTPAIESGEGAAEMKRLIETIGAPAALAVLAHRSGRDLAKSKPLLRDRLAHHLTLLEADATPGTVEDYRRMAERTWLPHLGALPIDAISRDAVIGWVAAQRKQETARSVAARARAKAAGKPLPPVVTYSPKSIANAHGLLSSVLQRAVEDELLTRNVAKGVGLPDDDAEREMEVLDYDEWARFIEAMDPHYRPLTMFLVTVGCRIGEATAIQVGDLDLTRGTVRFRRAWKKGAQGVYLGSTKSKRGKRTVVLPPALVAVLAEIVAGQPADAMVFTTRTRVRVQAQHFRSRQWERARTKAGITKHVTPHSLRHTSASWLLAANVSPIVVQHRLGHESLATTSKVYAHLLTDAQAGAMDVTQSALTRQIEAGS
jgi:integrase